MDQIHIKQFLAQLSSLNAKLHSTQGDEDDGLIRNNTIPAVSPVPLSSITTSEQSKPNPEASWPAKIGVKFLKKPNGYDGPTQFNLDVDLNANNGLFVKEWIYKKTRLPVTAQRLVYKGKALADETFLKEYYDGGASSPSGGWVIHCIPNVGVTVDPAEEVTVKAEKRKLSDEFWAGLDSYLSQHLEKEERGKVMNSFRRAYQDLNL